MRRTTLASALTAVVLFTASAFAGPIVIQMTGVDLAYDGAMISSVSSPDDLTSVVVDDVLYTTDIDLDVTIPGVTGLSVASGSSVTSDPGTLELSVDSGSLSLALDPATVSYIDLGGGLATFVFAATTADITGQSLPGGVVVGEPVQVSFSTQISEMTDDGTFITSFTTSGTGEIKGVPEPASALLAAFGVLALMVFRRR